MQSHLWAPLIRPQKADSVCTGDGEALNVVPTGCAASAPLGGCAVTTTHPAGCPPALAISCPPSLRRSCRPQGMAGAWQLLGAAQGCMWALKPVCPPLAWGKRGLRTEGPTPGPQPWAARTLYLWSPRPQHGLLSVGDCGGVLILQDSVTPKGPGDSPLTDGVMRSVEWTAGPSRLWSRGREPELGREGLAPDGGLL